MIKHKTFSSPEGLIRLFMWYAKMRKLMVCFGPVIKKRKKHEVASRGCAIGKSGGVHGLPAPQIRTCTGVKQISLGILWEHISLSLFLSCTHTHTQKTWCWFYYMYLSSFYVHLMSYMYCMFFFIFYMGHAPTKDTFKWLPALMDNVFESWAFAGWLSLHILSRSNSAFQASSASARRGSA